MDRASPCPPTLLCLPIEITLKVLAHLQPHDWAQVAQTCQSLNENCRSALATLTFLDLRHGASSLNDSSFTSLCKRLGKVLRRLELDCWHLSDSSLECLPENVEELVLCGCDHHSNKLLDHVSKRLNGKLRMFAWSGFGGAVTSRGIEDLALNNRGLTSFMIDSGTSMDVNKAVCTIARNCPSLRELSAYNLTMETLHYIFTCNISLQHFRHKQRRPSNFHVTDATLTHISRNCPLLKELILVDKSNAGDGLVLTDLGLLHLVERSSTIQILKLKPVQHSTASEISIMQLANLCSNLRQVELCNFKYLSDPPIYELVQKCTNLTELVLDYSQITDTALELVAHHCKSIQSISVKCCKKLTDAGLKALGQCGNLVSINMGQASGLTDGALTAICGGNPLLKVLVAGYAQISDRALQAVGTCKEMRELALNNCCRITNQGLETISRGCPMLRYISLSYCEHISDSGVISMAYGCSRLLKVRLDGCRLLSNPSVRILCTWNKKLRYLSMQHCMKLSDDVFQHLLSAKSLRFINLGRARLTTDALNAFHLQRPFVEISIDGRPHA